MDDIRKFTSIWASSADNTRFNLAFAAGLRVQDVLVEAGVLLRGFHNALRIDRTSALRVGIGMCKSTLAAPSPRKQPGARAGARPPPSPPRRSCRRPPSRGWTPRARGGWRGGGRGAGRPGRGWWRATPDRVRTPRPEAAGASTICTMAAVGVLGPGGQSAGAMCGGQGAGERRGGGEEAMAGEAGADGGWWRRARKPLAEAAAKLPPRPLWRWG